jgi:hypothetical protein
VEPIRHRKWHGAIDGSDSSSSSWQRLTVCRTDGGSHVGAGADDADESTCVSDMINHTCRSRRTLVEIFNAIHLSWSGGSALGNYEKDQVDRRNTARSRQISKRKSDGEEFVRPHAAGGGCGGSSSSDFC